jgi:hypothetical protein
MTGERKAALAPEQRIAFRMGIMGDHCQQH